MALKEFHIQEPAWNKKDTGSIDDVSKSMLKIKLKIILSRRLMIKKSY